MKSSRKTTLSQVRLDTAKMELLRGAEEWMDEDD